MRDKIIVIASFLMGWGAYPITMTQEVKTNAGEVAGHRSANGIWTFKGIPYAAPPINGLRWRPPTPVRSWTKTLEAKNFAAACPQPFESSGNEDCLYLNVWSPTIGGSRKFPTLVWIHGGGFSGESASMPLFDGEALAKRGAVVVTFDYRLGVFGFLGHVLLSKESVRSVSGNYGLLDQIAALKWVKQNISAFGGDPSKVTLFGQSAGAESIANFMVSPLAKDLFHRAISQSGFGAGMNQRLKAASGTQQSLEEQGTRIFERVGCKGKAALECMRKKSAKEILKRLYPDPMKSPIQFSPVTDGFVIPEDPGKLFALGRQTKIPVIAGMNSGEAAKNPELEIIKTVDGYKAYLLKNFQKDWKKVWAFFPVSADSEVKDTLQRLLTADFMVRHVRRMVLNMSALGPPTFLYYFSKVPPFAKSIGAFHELEVRYVFGTVMAKPDFDSKDFDVSEEIQKYWVQFAASGNPNMVDLPGWPVFRAADEAYLELGEVIKEGKRFYTDESKLLDNIEREAVPR